jgi:hypothetical protein
MYKFDYDDCFDVAASDSLNALDDSACKALLSYYYTIKPVAVVVVQSV